MKSLYLFSKFKWCQSAYLRLAMDLLIQKITLYGDRMKKLFFVVLLFCGSTAFSGECQCVSGGGVWELMLNGKSLHTFYDYYDCSLAEAVNTTCKAATGVNGCKAGVTCECDSSSNLVLGNKILGRYDGWGECAAAKYTNIACAVADACKSN